MECFSHLLVATDAAKAQNATPQTSSITSSVNTGGVRSKKKNGVLQTWISIHIVTIILFTCAFFCFATVAANIPPQTSLENLAVNIDCAPVSASIYNNNKTVQREKSILFPRSVDTIFASIDDLRVTHHNIWPLYSMLLIKGSLASSSARGIACFVPFLSLSCAVSMFVLYLCVCVYLSVCVCVSVCVSVCVWCKY